MWGNDPIWCSLHYLGALGVLNLGKSLASDNNRLLGMFYYLSSTELPRHQRAEYNRWFLFPAVQFLSSYWLSVPHTRVFLVSAIPEIWKKRSSGKWIRLKKPDLNIMLYISWLRKRKSLSIVFFGLTHELVFLCGKMWTKVFRCSVLLSRNFKFCNCSRQGPFWVPVEVNNDCLNRFLEKWEHLLTSSVFDIS